MDHQSNDLVLARTRARARTRERGVALVLVLSCIVMIAMLVVSFLLMVRTDQQSSNAFATTSEARLLGDIPINITIGQIRRGSEQLGYQQSWASQPGMIRTYGLENDGTGYRSRATGLYKLYSDDRMVVNTGGNVTPTSGGLAPADVASAISADVADLATWDSRPGMFTDINEPVPFRVQGSSALDISFPVVDPRALTPGGTALPVEGFDYTASAVPGALKPATATDIRTRLPMPVKWIYVLKDGGFVTPSAATATTASFSGATVPTTDNPIVGRIAFWTDDDSTKVNVNTASEGTPWYTPVTTNDTDRNFAERLPAHFEYSRAPGHPAQTSLSPVFQVFNANLAVPPGLSDNELAARLQKYHQINPRLNWGGTRGGTQVAPLGEEFPENKTRLYANLDELLLTPDRQVQDASITSERLDMARFFLTTNARAPEMSLHNKFRFSLWINWATAAERTSLDNIHELVNSAGVRGGGSSYNNQGAFNRGLGWSFFRKNGFKLAGTSLSGASSQYSQGTDADHPSNMDRLLDVLQRATGSTVSGGASNYTRLPGFANSTFVEKYGTKQRDQILLSMMDVLRSGVDYYRPVKPGKSSYVPQPDTPGNTNRVGEFSNVPTRNTFGRGFGRVPTVSEVAVVFMATAADAGGTATEMQAFLVLEPFSPFSGPPAWASNVYYKIEGLENLKVTVGTEEVPLFPGRNKLVSKVNFNPGLMAGGNKSPFGGMLAQFARSDAASFAPLNPASMVASIRYPFISDRIPLSGAEEFKFSGGQLVVTVVSGWQDPTVVADGPIPQSAFQQRLNIPLAGYNGPTTAFKTPATFAFPAPRILPSDGATYDTLGKRLGLLSGGGSFRPDVILRRGDIVRSTQVSHLQSSPARGDLRIFAALPEVPANYFVPTGAADYLNTGLEIVHDLRCGSFSPDETPFLNDVTITPGRLVYNLNYHPSVQPAAPRGLAAAVKKDNKPGDWDNGVGDIEDGPYINRADTGSRWFGANGGYYGRGPMPVEEATKFDLTFSPHRNAPSAVIFGGILSEMDTANPAGVQPWQTLLFCPNPPSRRTAALAEPTAADHKGFGAPRDHLLLDLFWMPAVQPYALSESLSSAGKINMNYQMMPFTYIERSTGIHAAMKATRVTAISRASASGNDHYKSPAGHPYETRYLVNVAETLKGFRNRFENNHDLFRSASEICEIFLVPQRIPGATYAPDVPAIPEYAGMTAWWNGNNPSSTSVHPLGLTGDNTREAPYSDLYPRLTARSNTYTVHYRVQTLTKARSSGPAEWEEGRDIVTGEHRGSATLERYIDPNNFQVASINQGGTKYADSWDGFFRFRIISRKDFAP